MTNPPKCTECGIGELRPSTDSQFFGTGDHTYFVEGLECMFCDQCGADPIYPDQIKRNEQRINKAKEYSDD